MRETARGTNHLHIALCWLRAIDLQSAECGGVHTLEMKSPSSDNGMPFLIGVP